MNLSHDYVAIPKQAVIDLHDNPLALGLYMLVARLYLIYQRPVPLSRGDIRRFDPSVKEGAAKRALDRLTEQGWLSEIEGYKQQFTPNWGQDRNGAPYPWRMGVDLLGSPMYVWCRAVRVHRNLLDVFLGKISPHARFSTVERYTTVPLLQLSGIGTYICVTAGLTGLESTVLEQWGLLKDGKAQPIPEAEVILALASQRATTTGFQLTEAAWRKLGWLDETDQPTPETTFEPTPLLFVPRERIGQPIGQPIGQRKAEEQSLQASESTTTRSCMSWANMTGISSEKKDPREPPPTPPSGGFSSPKRFAEKPLPHSETVSLLQAIGAHAQSIADLANMPAEQVQGAIAYARSQPNIQSIAGWVVDALRRFRDDGQPIPSSEQQQPAFDVARIMQDYGDVFRLGSDTSPLPTLSLPASQQASPAPSAGWPHTPGAAKPAAAIQPARPPTTPQAVLAQPLKTKRSPGDIEHELQAQLLLCCTRTEHGIVRRLSVRVIDNTTVVCCATPSDRHWVSDKLSGAVRRAAADLGLPSVLKITDAAAPGRLGGVG